MNTQPNERMEEALLQEIKRLETVVTLLGGNVKQIKSEVAIAWAPTGEWPDQNELVLIWLEGYKHHSGKNWERSGHSLLPYHGDPKDPLSPFSERMPFSLIGLDADYLEVTHWARLPPSPSDTTKEQNK